MKPRGLALAHIATTFAVAESSPHRSFAVRVVAVRLDSVLGTVDAANYPE